MTVGRGDSREPVRRGVIQSLVQNGVAVGHVFRPQVVSGSMWPLLRIGDRVVVEKTSLAELCPGEIVVVAMRNGDLLTHRFVGRVAASAGDGFLTKADRASSLDPIWQGDQLTGRVQQIERGKRKLALRSSWRCYGPRVIGVLVLWEWGLLANCRRGWIKRGLHKGVAILCWLAAGLAWALGGRKLD